MEKITFDGVEYTKAAVVAKQFGYTSDYIGQLCRSKKVDARLVGRSWFVNVSTLEKHRKQKYQKKTTPVKEYITDRRVQSKKFFEDTQVTDIATKKYLRRVSAPNARLHKVLKRTPSEPHSSQFVSVKYEPDEQSLIPKVEHSPKVKLLKVNMAESAPVLIKSYTNQGVSTLMPEALPDVALSGVVGVTEIPDSEYSNDEPQNAKPAENISNKRDNTKNETKISSFEGRAESNLVKDRGPVKRKKLLVSKATKPQPKVEKNQIKVCTVESTAPEVSSLLKSNELPVVDLNKGDGSVSIHSLLPAVGLVAGVVLAVFLLSAEQTAFVSNQMVNFSLKFDWSNISNLASVLFTG